MAAAVGMGSGDHLPSFCSRAGLVNFVKGPRVYFRYGRESSVPTAQLCHQSVKVAANHL